VKGINYGTGKPSALVQSYLSRLTSLHPNPSNISLVRFLQFRKETCLREGPRVRESDRRAECDIDGHEPRVKEVMLESFEVAEPSRA